MTLSSRAVHGLIALCAAPLAGGSSNSVAVSPSGLQQTRFTDELRALAGAKWEAVVNHRFTDELAAGTIDGGVLARYLIQDHRFLDSFVVLLSSMVAAAPTLNSRIPGCQFLALITGRENTYFERSFAALGVDEATRSAAPDAAPTVAFNALMRDAAKSSYAEMLAVLVVAEWSYQSWGERVLPVAAAEPFTSREWVDLHSGPYFGSVVEYLRGLLDEAAATLSLAERAAVERRFLAAVDIELAFFEAAVDGGASTGTGVFVTVDVPADRVDEFLTVMRADAEESRKEEGCLRFDLLDLGGGRFAFYEVYRDAAAMQHHKTLPHYKAWAEFKAANKGTVGASQTVVKFDGLSPLH